MFKILYHIVQKTCPKHDPKICSNMHHFWSKMEPKWGPYSLIPLPVFPYVALWAPKGPPRASQGRPKSAQGPHFGAPGPPKGTQGSHFGRQKTPQGLHFGTFWVPWAHLHSPSPTFSILDLEKTLQGPIHQIFVTLAVIQQFFFVKFSRFPISPQAFFTCANRDEGGVIHGGTPLIAVAIPPGLNPQRLLGTPRPCFGHFFVMS